MVCVLFAEFAVKKRGALLPTNSRSNLSL